MYLDFYTPYHNIYIYSYTTRYLDLYVYLHTANHNIYSTFILHIVTYTCTLISHVIIHIYIFTSYAIVCMCIAQRNKSMDSYTMHHKKGVH